MDCGKSVTSMFILLDIGEPVWAGVFALIAGITTAWSQPRWESIGKKGLVTSINKLRHLKHYFSQLYSQLTVQFHTVKDVRFV